MAKASIKKADVEVTLVLTGQQAADLWNLLGNTSGCGPVMGNTILPIYQQLDQFTEDLPKSQDISAIRLLGPKGG